MVNENPKQHVIAKRLILVMVLSSTLITLILSSFQIYNDFQKDVAGIENRLAEIQSAHLESIVSRVWTANNLELKTDLKALLNLSDISYLEVSEGNKIIASAGKPLSEQVIIQKFPLLYSFKGDELSLGQLLVHASLSNVYKKAIDQGIIIVVSNGLKTFLVVGIMFVVFYRLVTRHLEQISLHVNNSVLALSFNELKLDRNLHSSNNGDELQQVVSAINEFQDRMFLSYSQLQDSEQRFRLLAENIAGVFWIGSPDWQKVYYVSPAYEDIWGRSPQELYNNAMSWVDNVHVEDRQLVVNDISGRSLGMVDSPFFPEYRICLPNGQIKWISARAYPVHDKDGNVERIVGLAVDISDRKEAELKLIQSEDKFKTLMETSGDGIIVVDEQGRIVMTNPMAYNIFGYEDGELEGLDIGNLVPQDVAIHREYMAKFWEKPSQRPMKDSGTIYGLKKDGTKVPLEISLSPLQTNDGMMVSAVVHDMTTSFEALQERERMQRQLQQGQKMQAIGQLTGGVAHDFNNLLAAILGFSELAKKKLASSDDEKIKDYIEEIERAGTRARDLVRQMLAFSRNDKQEMQMLDLVVIVKESVKMMQATLPSSITTTLNLKGQLPSVLGNSVQLHQVIMNLLVNARDALGGKGKVDIGLEEASKVLSVCDSCHEEFEGEFILLSVADDGSGIPPEIMGDIFDPFYTTKERGKGTGMGLSMVHGIVHNHRGHIEVESNSKGTIFNIYLPLDHSMEVESVEEVKMKSPASDHGVGHILVVDDEKSIVRLYKEALSEKGFQVTVETDSEVALSLFKNYQEKFDLVITDQTMPNLTGIEMAKEMLKIKPDIPVVMCTGYSDYVDNELAKEVGIKEFFTKPVDAKLLSDAIYRLLG